MMRLAERLSPPRLNRLTEAVARRQAAGLPLLDLTVSNPTQAGFCVRADELATALAQPAAVRYEPDPRGLLSARRALCTYLDDDAGPHGVEPDDVFLCACSSEAYALLLKLLCRPGDQVLVPRPSYPLLEHLVALEGVEPVFYTLRYDGHWRVDLSEVAAGLERGRVRAVLAVNPNNPTGSFLDAATLQRLAQLCADAQRRAGRAVALVGDEVFFDYPLTEADEAAEAPAQRVSVAAQDIALAFRIGGLSKSAGLPQMKASWITLHGPRSLREQAAAQLDVIADTYLSVGTPVQLALPRLLELGAAVRDGIRARVEGNRDLVDEMLAGFPACQRLVAEGGWSAVLRVPALRSEEQLVVELVERDGVLIHPGYFFDFEREAYLVLSLLVPPNDLGAALPRVLRRATTAPAAA